MLDRAKLAKFLGMTDSAADGEALNAMRFANRLVKEAGMTWEQVLAAPSLNGVTVTVTRHAPPQPTEQGEDWVAPHLKDKVTIDLMFRAVFAQPRGDNEEFWQTMDSIHQWFRDHGSLNQKQYQALRNCYVRTLRRQG